MIAGHQDPDNVREITGQLPNQSGLVIKGMKTYHVQDNSGIQDHDPRWNQVYIRLGRIPRSVHFTSKCLTTLVIGGPTIPIIARRYYIVRNVHSESTKLGTVFTRILSSLTKPTWQHSQIILSSPTTRRNTIQSDSTTRESGAHVPRSAAKLPLISDKPK